MTRRRDPLICLAASGGGHLRQVLELEPFWQRHRRFFVSEDSALSRSLADTEEVHFVPHFALGQARLGKPFTMLSRAWRSAWRSLAIVREKRPDWVVTTGAGSQIFVVLWARLLGAKIVLIDSFARFEKPSAFARLAGPLALYRIAQAEKAAAAWGDAEWFDPLRETGKEPPEKEDLLVATVGATLPFPRLGGAVLAAKTSGAIPERVVVQTGTEEAHKASEEGVTVAESLPFDAMQAMLAKARIVVCHGGTGSILTALRHGCRVLVIPREFARGEHYDDHQAEITAAFAKRGLIVTPRVGESFVDALERTRRMDVRSVVTDYGALIARLDAILAGE